MNRQDFINLLFNNCNGLTLDEIETIEGVLWGALPEDMLTDLMNDNGYTENDAIDVLMIDARQVFINKLHDCTDLLMIRSYMKEAFDLELTDKEVYTLYYLR